MNSVTILPSPLTTNSKADYLLTIAAIGTVAKNSILKIEIPEQIRFMEYATTCQVNAIQQFC